MAITTLDGLIATADQLKSFGKASMTAKAAGTFQSLWTAGGLPTSGVAPVATTVVVPTSARGTGINYIEMNVPTNDIPKGSYYFRSFITYPDGFIQCASNELVDITF